MTPEEFITIAVSEGFKIGPPLPTPWEITLVMHAGPEMSRLQLTTALIERESEESLRSLLRFWRSWCATGSHRSTGSSPRRPLGIALSGGLSQTETPTEERAERQGPGPLTESELNQYWQRLREASDEGLIGSSSIDSRAIRPREFRRLLLEIDRLRKRRPPE